MTLSKTRSRQVSFRVSPDEWDALERVCAQVGARSVSDLLRDAMYNVLRGVNRADSFFSNLDEFRAGMRSLERKIEKLEAKITTSEPGSVD